MEDGLWITQVQNGEVFTKAYATCRNVILFFSINKSRGFQGYARMTTAPSQSTPRPKWMVGIHWETTQPFRVEWFNKTTTSFQYVHHLRNALNGDLPVIIGKDGQEIEESCGRDLIKEMDSTVKWDTDRERGWEREEARRPLGPPPTRRVGSGLVSRGGGDAGRSWIKREEEP